MYKLLLCLRYMTRRKIVYFSVAGMVIGIMVLIVVTSLFGGFSREIRERIRGFSSHIVVRRPWGRIADYGRLVALLERQPHVVAVAPHVEGLAYVSHRGVIYPKPVQVIGIDPGREIGRPGAPGVSELGRYLVEGDAGLVPPGGGASPPGALIGSALLEGRACALGERLWLATVLNREGVAGVDYDHVTQTFAVAGRFTSRMNEYDRGYVYVPLAAAQAFLRTGDTVTQVAVRVDDHAQAKRILAGLSDALRATEGFEGLVATSWEDLPGKRNLLQAVDREKGIQVVILFIIVIVAAFNIVAILTLLVDLKTRDIGILRALGATSWGVSGLYLLNGVTIGAVGSALGVALGVAVAYGLDPLEKLVFQLTHFRLFPPEIYFLDAVPAEVDPGTVAFVVGATLVTSLVFSVYPAWKASRLNPVEAIRHE
jgi:lipoprotein-releasing system permease protein